MREKYTEASIDLRPIISDSVLDKAIAKGTKFRTDAILKDAMKYARNRAKSEKILPRFLAEEVFEQCGIKRKPERTGKTPKKSAPVDDQKGGSHGHD